MSIRRENRIRNTVLVCFELFSLFSVIFFLLRGEGERILLSLATLFLLLLPIAAERVFHCRLSLPLCLLSMFFAVGPLLGHSWKFYYLLPGWDKLLHITSGVLFAILGVYLPHAILRRKPDHLLMTAIFALCFSITISVIWEFFEYGMDFFFAMDMQQDTVVHSIHSYMLGDGLGVSGSIEQIEEVLINGRELGLGGYLDIGLIDTLNDMLLESLGALVYVLIYYLTGGMRQAIRPEPSMTENEEQ